MATATPYPSSPRWDVFLSFCGVDTRRNFISHLYDALDLAGILTFRDDPALSMGEEISSHLHNAIRNSKKFVVVFSENYASSTWCLDELVEILSNFKRGNNRVIPVFYYVDPSDIWRSFGKALDGHKSRYSVEIVDKWRSALIQIAELSGYHLTKDANESEADFINEIVDCVLPKTNPKTCWDVFLSFCGDDTQYTFTSHLYSALVRHGLGTFKDDPELRTGEVISDALLQAIQESTIYIVVFSENYASSSWCLDELVEILECCTSIGRLVVPIFYNIEKSVVRDQTGNFNEAFEKHKTHFHKDRLAKWRATLTDMAIRSGYPDCKNMSEADIINKVVDRVLLEVNPMTLDVAKYPVGLGSRVRRITALLNSNTDSNTDGITRIGIHGMGGVGKTTLAKAVYNQNYHRFQGSCFLENVREASQTERGLVCLQQQLVSDVLKCKNVYIDNVYHGIASIRAKICSMKALIVIDDLESPIALDFLLGPFAFGSTIIITTRNEDLLDSIKVEARYRVNELGDAESRRLFSQHAFGDNEIPDTFMELSQEILDRAGGLPLALKVFGSKLLNQSKEGVISIDQLERLSSDDVEKKLQISFDALKLVDPMLQDIFLDIACFFIGWMKEDAVKIMETCYTFVSDNVDILKKRCLLMINDRYELEMHDLLRDMGREIARNNYPDEPGKHSRLWEPKDIDDVLKKHKGTKAIEGIIPSNVYYQNAFEGVSFATATFKMMINLRFLHIKNVDLSGSFEDIFENLTWLRWDSCPLECLPSDFCPEELVLLALRCSKLRRMWKLNMDSQVLRKLKTLDMSYSLDLTITPDFTKLPCLETLNLEGCKSLEGVHESIGLLVSLSYLNLRICINLRSLPENICNLRALKHLDIGGCSSLEALPIKLGNIESLTELNAWGLTAVSKIPDSIIHLSNLRELNLSDYEYGNSWDVFVSFHGLDTRPTFISHLYYALDRNGVNTFKDCEAMSNTLIRVIRESKTYIVVFSERYAFSSWCLDKLVEILKSHKTMKRPIIVVYDNIDPSVVRHQMESFEAAFKEHEIRYEMEKVNEWRRTLTEVAGFSGFHISDRSDEADIVIKVVDTVLREVGLYVARYPVGLDCRVQDIRGILLSSSDKEGVIKIGLYGVGGVGKSTLARALYSHLFRSFKGICFLSNVREVWWTTKGLVSLQQQLINGVLGTDKVKVHNVDQGTKIIQSILCLTKILVVVDDLDDHKQFESLVGPFASGSVVIVTTRDEEVLDKIGVQPRYRYMVNVLDDAESLQLFTRHAFGDDRPDNTLLELSKVILHHAGGLPSALVASGSHLYNQSEVAWKDYIQKQIFSKDSKESDEHKDSIESDEQKDSIESDDDSTIASVESTIESDEQK